MTYGQLAALAGSPTAARIVGGIAHFGDPDLPWQRVVNKQGGLARGYPGGRSGHRQALEVEGIVVQPNDCVDIDRLLWWPPDSVEDSNILNSGNKKVIQNDIISDNITDLVL